MLDSGAYSAWNQDETIDLKSYIKFVKQNERYLFSHVVLDVLPPGVEAKRTPESIESCAKQSYTNLQKMKDAGLNPIPVFHQGEDFKWLERLLKDGEKYIGISTIKAQWNKQIIQRKWLDECFNIVTNAKGEPIVNTHGFGVTSPPLLFKYPFYTVDSTTWSKAAGYGRILVPAVSSGKTFHYEKNPIQVAISGVNKYGHSSPKWRKSRRGYFEGLGPNMQKAVTHFLENEINISVQEARHSSHTRRQALLLYYLKLCEKASFHNFHRKGNSLFGLPHGSAKGVKRYPLQMMFATTTDNPAWAHLMQEVNTQNQLLSYYNLRDAPEDTLERYATTGIAKEWEKQYPKTDWPTDGEHNSYTNFRCMKLLERIKNGKDRQDDVGVEPEDSYAGSN